jgi:hypothetical protein
MCWGRRLAPVLAAATLLAGALAPAALADGDPASDYLIGQPVYVPPTDKNVPLSDAGLLDLLVTDAKRRGFTIKVALIGTPTDLGSVTSLWRRPQRYAQFLSEELFYVYKQPLLIVMPNGFGIARRGKPLPAERKLLDAIPVAAGGISNLPVAASGAVQRLAAARGLHLAAPKAPDTARRESHDRVTIIVAAVAVLLLLAAVALARRRWRTAHHHPGGDR